MPRNVIRKEHEPGLEPWTWRSITSAARRRRLRTRLVELTRNGVVVGGRADGEVVAAALNGLARVGNQGGDVDLGPHAQAWQAGHAP